jgi:hypothetical protein
VGQGDLGLFSLPLCQVAKTRTAEMPQTNGKWSRRWWRRARRSPPQPVVKTETTSAAKGIPLSRNRRGVAVYTKLVATSSNSVAIELLAQEVLQHFWCSI